MLFTVFSLLELFFSCCIVVAVTKENYLKSRPLFRSQIISGSKCCDIQGSHLIGYLWVSLIIDPSECLICYLFALNQPSSALNYLKTTFTLTNQNWVILSCILLGREITFEYTHRLETLNPGNKRCYKKWNERIFIISDCNFHNAIFPSNNFIWWLDS